jgi:hypothetical protein
MHYKFIKGNIAEYEFWRWSSEEIDRLETIDLDTSVIVEPVP